MKRISCYWVFDEQIVLRLSCLRLFYQVTACTLVFLLLQLMQLPQIVVLLSFLIQGEYLLVLQKELSGYFFFLLSSNCLHCRASPSEFVIPLAKYVKAVYHTRVSVGMRFRMLFETEESSVRR